MLHTYRQTDIQTEPPTKRVLEEHLLLKRTSSRKKKIDELFNSYDCCKEIAKKCSDKKVIHFSEVSSPEVT